MYVRPLSERVGERSYHSLDTTYEIESNKKFSKFNNKKICPNYNKLQSNRRRNAHTDSSRTTNQIEYGTLKHLNETINETIDRELIETLDSERLNHKTNKRPDARPNHRRSYANDLFRFGNKKRKDAKSIGKRDENRMKNGLKNGQASNLIANFSLLIDRKTNQLIGEVSDENRSANGDHTKLDAILDQTEDSILNLIANSPIDPLVNSTSDATSESTIEWEFKTAIYTNNTSTFHCDQNLNFDCTLGNLTNQTIRQQTNRISTADSMIEEETSYCIPLEKKCNGKSDCPNGVDESELICGK